MPRKKLAHPFIPPLQGGKAEAVEFTRFRANSQAVPKLHMTKVAFACRDLEMLQQRIAGRAIGGEVRVVTRMRPKRAAELIESWSRREGDGEEGRKPPPPVI